MSEAMTIFTALLTLATSKGGEAALSAIFADHKLTLDSMQKAVAALKDPTPPHIASNVTDVKH
jgi:hypothetical protein